MADPTQVEYVGVTYTAHDAAPTPSIKVFFREGVPVGVVFSGPASTKTFRLLGNEAPCSSQEELRECLQSADLGKSLANNLKELGTLLRGMSVPGESPKPKE